MPFGILAPSSTAELGPCHGRADSAGFHRTQRFTVRNRSLGTVYLCGTVTHVRWSPASSVTRIWAPPAPMATNDSTLGACPVCGTKIPAGLLLIEYERNEDRAMYAECPACEEPVHPQ